MGSRGNVGCVGAFAMFFVVMLVISLVMFVLFLAAVVAALAAAGWLVVSAIRDLRRRGALTAGTEPTQITGAHADGLAEQALAAARDGVMSTLTDWEQLRTTRGIGTPLQQTFGRLEEHTVRDLEFQNLTVRASTQHAQSFHLESATARDKVATANELDSLTLELRRAIHDAARR